MTKAPSLARARWLREPGLQRLFAAIAAAGGEARVAGGAVRNALLGIPVADVDVATTLDPQRVSEVCTAAGMKVHPTGIDHGTVTVVVDHRPYEVTTLRRDVETFGRKARVAFHDDWAADARRRDFTMNALYCDAHGNIHDFVRGYEDVLRKRIIFVGTPSQRIREDFLRILRFFRFHACFGKGAPDEAGLAACVRLRKGLDNLSAERIRQEFFKLLAAPGAVATLKVMAGRSVLSHIIPYADQWRIVSRLPSDPLLRLYAIAREPTGLKERLRLSNHEARRIEALGAVPPPTPALRPRERKIVLYQLGAEAWSDLVHLGLARSRSRLDDPAWRRLLCLPMRWPVPTLPVTGRDLISAGIAPGPEIGLMLRQLEDWWLASGFTMSKDDLLKRVPLGGGPS